MTIIKQGNEKGLKYAVVYIRVSSEKESQDDSYEEQYEEMMEFAKRKGFKVLKVYKERVTATKISGRDQFDELLEDVIKGEFDAVLFKDLSRSARNIEISAKLKRLCLENRIGIYSMTEGDHLELESLNYNFRAMMNEHYSMEFSAKIKSRFRRKMEKGEFINGEPPYGYYLKDNKLYIREDDSPSIVKRIFREYLDGRGVDAIAKRLTEDKVMSPSMLKGKSNAGLVWHGTTVRKILENRAYCGDVEQGKEETVSAISKVRIKNEKTVLVENMHEPIISKELFFEVQNLIKSRKIGPRPTPQKHMFTDILICCKCGKKYWYRASGDRYVCGSYARCGKRVCDSNPIKEDKLIEIVTNELKDIISTYKVNETIEEKIEGKIKSKVYKIKNEKKILAEKLQKFEEAKAELIVSKITRDITTKDYDLALKIVERKIKETFFGLEDFNELNREMLFRFVEKIIVHGKKDFEIVFRFKL